VDIDRATAAGMIGLGSWGTASMIWGGISLSQAEPDSWDEGFARMNLVWGAVNASIAGSTGLMLGLRARKAVSPAEKARFTALKRTSLAVNLGLDFGYVAIGLLIEQLGKANADPRLEGMGPAIALQGAVLIGFDAILLAIHLVHERAATAPPPVALGQNGLTIRF
tara:strand:- start:633 stop:1130 length:498 start_codon:yes stop_codon:yes gene_type:complete